MASKAGRPRLWVAVALVGSLLAVGDYALRRLRLGGALQERGELDAATGRVRLRVSHEQEIWVSGGLFQVQADSLRSPLRPNVDVEFTPLKHGLANLEVVSLDSAPAHRVFTNNKGFRTREFRWAKSPGVFRIVVMGDSAAYGLAVDSEEAFSAVLERQLGGRARDRAERGDIEVLNLAAPGMTLAAVRELYMGLSELEADVVVFGSAFNDYGYCNRSDHKPLNSIKVPRHQWQLRDATSQQPPPAPPDADILATAVAYGREACPPDQTLESYEAVLRTLVGDVRRRGAAPVFVDLEFARRLYRSTAVRVASELDLPVHDAPDELLNEERVRSAGRDPELASGLCAAAPMKPKAKYVRWRVRVASPPGGPPSRGYSLVAQPLGRDVFKVLPQAPWSGAALRMRDEDGDGVYSTIVSLPVGETVKFFFVPGSPTSWSAAELSPPQTDGELAGRARVWLTYPNELARYHRACDPEDLYTSPLYVYGRWDLMYEAMHPNAAGHEVIGRTLAPVIRALQRYRDWGDTAGTGSEPGPGGGDKPSPGG